MKMLDTCRRLLAGAALFGCLGLGAQPAAATSTITQYGYWASTLDTDDDGHRVCGVRTRMDGGGELRLMVIGGAVHLVAHDPRWHMRYGDSFHVAIGVDDGMFGGNGQAVDGQTILVKSLSNNFLGQFIEGGQMVANFGGVRWSVSLVGSGRATGDMGACLGAIQRGFLS
jgi:hypothetical protein